jgi:plastocyanin
MPRGSRLVAAAVLAAGSGVTSHLMTAAATHRVVAGPDGWFRPAVLHIREGDTVEWTLNGRTSAIVAAEAAPAPGTCPTPRAFAANDPGNFTGPMPFAPSGIFSLGPLAPQATTEETWADPNNVGVFVRLLWDRLQRAPGTSDASFDFTELDRDITLAVRHGKVYSLAIKAGNEGTPDWIFSTNQNGRGRPGNGGGVTRLFFQDVGNEREMRGCGSRMTLGSPTDPMFERHYFDMLTKVAAHIRARADWYRALAYIKPSGANLFSHENRLPQNCQQGCICNPQVFAQNGYTPSKLYGFYRRQFALLAKEFPGKAISYALIQAGFPLVNDSGGWEQVNGRSSNRDPLPTGTEQTEHILRMGREDLSSLFVVQHNGLQPYRPGCANEGRHPAKPPYTQRGSGCPNHWVLRAGADGKTITGLQTETPNDVGTPAEIDLALKNAFVNSDASFVELYEGPLRLAVTANNGVLPSGKTIARWADDFHERRRKMYSSMGDPFPKTYGHAFKRVSPSTLYYFDPSACRASTPPFGTIIVDR